MAGAASCRDSPVNSLQISLRVSGMSRSSCGSPSLGWAAVRTDKNAWASSARMVTGARRSSSGPREGRSRLARTSSGLPSDEGVGLGPAGEMTGRAALTRLAELRDTLMLTASLAGLASGMCAAAERPSAPPYWARMVPLSRSVTLAARPLSAPTRPRHLEFDLGEDDSEEMASAASSSRLTAPAGSRTGRRAASGTFASANGFSGAPDQVSLRCRRGSRTHRPPGTVPGAQDDAVPQSMAVRG